MAKFERKRYISEGFLYKLIIQRFKKSKVPIFVNFYELLKMRENCGVYSDMFIEYFFQKPSYPDLP